MTPVKGKDYVTLKVEILLVTLFLVTLIQSFVLCVLLLFVCLPFCPAVNFYKQYAAKINTYKYLQSFTYQHHLLELMLLRPKACSGFLFRFSLF